VWREDDPLILRKEEGGTTIGKPLMEAPPQILILKSESLQGGVLFRGLKTTNPG
jgi:hypothetical protein